MFVVMYVASLFTLDIYTNPARRALVTTFATTPLTKVLYPPWYQKKLAAWKRGEIDWDGNHLISSDDDSSIAKQGEAAILKINKMTMLLRLESLPSLFTILNLLGGSSEPVVPKTHRAKQRQLEDVAEESTRPNTPAVIPYKRPLEVHGLRMIELTQRTSTVMTVSEVSEFTDRDPVLNVFKAFGRLNHLAVSAEISVAPLDSFAEVLTTKANDRGSELLLVPWSETGIVSDLENPTGAGAVENRFISHSHNQFIDQVLSSANCNTAILVNRGLGGLERTMTRRPSVHSVHSRTNAHFHETPIAPIADPSHHIFFPFFGGEDDKLALRFVLQLVGNVHVTATIVHVVYRKDAVIKVPEITRPPPSFKSDLARRDLPRGLSLSNVPTLSSIPADDATRFEQIEHADDVIFQSTIDSIPAAIADRVLFERIETAHPLQYSLNRAREELGSLTKNAGDLLVLGRASSEARSHIRMGLVEVLTQLEVPSGAGAEVRKCLGDVAEAAMVAGVKASLLVVQAKDGKGKGMGPPSPRVGPSEAEVEPLNKELA